MLQPIRRPSYLKRAALWLYIAAFAVLCVLAWFDADSTETTMERSADILLSGVTLVGLVAYAARLAYRTMIQAWKAVAPLILIGYMFQFVSAWPDLAAADPDLTVREQFAIVLFALGVFTIFLVPAVVINFRLARGRHLITEPAAA